MDIREGKNALLTRNPALQQKSLSFSIIKKRDRLIATKIWQLIENQIESPEITSSSKWIDLWLKHFGNTVHYFFIVAFNDEQPIGITLIAQEKKRNLPLPVRSYHIGTAGEPYELALQMTENSILVVRQYKEEFYRGMIKLLIKKTLWQEFVFDDYSKEDATIILGIVNEMKLKPRIEGKKCPEFSLQTPFECPIKDVLEKYSYDTRYSIRRSLKVFENDLEVTWAETKEEALSILDDLIVFYNNQMKGRGIRSMFDSSTFLAFQKEWIEEMFDPKKIILVRVWNKTYGTLGCSMMYAVGKRTIGYQIGINDFANVEFETINKKRLRTGFIIHYLSMVEAFKRGFTHYNFSVGEYDYKYELTNDESKVITITIQRGIIAPLRSFIVTFYKKHDIGRKITLFKNWVTNPVRLPKWAPGFPIARI